MMRHVLSLSLVLLLSSNGPSLLTIGFAPRPGYYHNGLRRSGATTQQSPLVLTQQRRGGGRPLSAVSTLLEQQQVIKTRRPTNDSTVDDDLPFYANPASNDDDALLSAKDYYQRQQVQVLPREQTTESSFLAPQQQEDNNNINLAELAPVVTMITALSSFLLVNNFIGPWPATILAAVPIKVFGLTHALAGMLFGGGIVLTTLLEWLAIGSNNSTVLQFYFDKVPKLDAFVVLPALAASIVSGVGLAVDHYGSLAESPFHIVGAISTLLAFAMWWAVTDVTTQRAAMDAIQQWTTATADGDGSGEKPMEKEVPQIVQFRKLSNVVSCLFVAALYGFMVLKPGYTPPPVVM